MKKNVLLSEVFKSIEQQTAYLFFFDKDQIAETRPIDVKIKNATLDEALKICLENQLLTYKIVNNTIVIQPEMAIAYAVATPKNALLSPPPVEIRGRVANHKGEPLQNVSVLITGTNIGTTTDADGRFTLNAPNDKSVEIEISIIGYQKKIVKVGRQTDLNIMLDDDISGLNEVVVIGYGTARKKDITGAVSNINSTRLLDKPSVNVGQALQNKIAGVDVNNMGGGVPGQNPLVRIRGTNSITAGNDPLYVVDGVVGVANPLATLNPNDINSIDVLKDASATAIYGARGANGVIIITTKRGTSGKPQISISSTVSKNTLQRHLYALDADQLMYLYLQSMNNATKYGSVVPANDFRGTTAGSTSFSEMPWLFKQVPKNGYSIPLIGKDGNSYAPIYNTNWEDLMFANSTSQNHYVAIRGGSEIAKFSVSLGATDERGLMKNSYFKRLTGRIAGDIKALKWLTLSTSIGFNKSRATGDDGITRSATEVWSILPVQYPQDPSLGIYAGRWGTNFDFKTGEQWYNVVFRRSQIYQQNNIGQVTGSFTSVAQITKDLSFKSDFSIDYNNYKNNSYSGKLYGGDGSASISGRETYFWQNENYFNYNKQLGRNQMLSAVLGLSWSKYSYQNMNTSNSVFFSNFFGYSNLGAGASPRPGAGSSDGNNTLNSYFSRINYSFKDRYMITVTGREDGSSRFGANNKYGFFPSAGVAWRVSQEKFMQNIDAISNLKVRASIGRTGNQEIGSYVTQPFISTANVVLNNATQIALFPSSVANPDLKWETTTQKDLGLEVGFFNDRVNIGVDFYNKLTSNMLLNVPLPLSTTTGSVIQNYGKVQNRGWEFTVNTLNISTKNLKWNTDITVAANRNKIVQLGPTGAPIYSQTGAGNGTSVFMIG
ncbi:MAG: SusC/RagA family TonB-linked outer membrane protein, partial [Sediminibacterium sp.]